ncbi:hypothetical protein [Caldifermentibacillus hisashii]|uniref:hypothetical protein n=1 Tax=Caldifermentibacillus hisashii TaxID=996558 RepID=UPI001C10E7F6|nr:hypothetical protein [Caldifermentibacillus hisashii]MBU5343057.1 hypothetical protein [Caldifermentibacillus hisashii]
MHLRKPINRRNPISSPFWGEKRFFLAKPESRHHLEPKNALFWRRNSISSPF